MGAYQCSCGKSVFKLIIAWSPVQIRVGPPLSIAYSHMSRNSRIVEEGASGHVSFVRHLIAILSTGTWFTAAQANQLDPQALRPVSGIDPDSTVYALSIVFALTFILTFYVGVLYFRERRRIKEAKADANTVQTNPASFAPAMPKVEMLSMEAWQQRALTAEALANNQAVLLREKLMPELTEFVKQSLVHGLAAQRDALLAMQQQAMQSLIEMESRLAALQAPMQDRVRAYESRISELEKELSVQGAEMRELTRTILQMMRKKLEEEQQAEKLDTFQ